MLTYQPKRFMLSRRSVISAIVSLVCFVLLAPQGAWAVEADVVFPGAHWETRSPAELDFDESKLALFAERVGGDGCVIAGGYLVKSWGDPSRHSDWASAAKPVLSTLLMLAVETRKLPSLDARVNTLGWPLSKKDEGMTFRHLANMVSGYGRGEAPGEAWGYNDYAIQLYAKSLERVFQEPLDRVLRRHLEVLQFEDGVIFGSRGGTGVSASPRDFARLGWLWLYRGRWKDKALIAKDLMDEFLRVGVPVELNRTAIEGNDYLEIGSYGGGTDQTPAGPGVYGFNLWFNEMTPSGQRVWPALPPDAFQANGMWNRDTVTVVPSLKLVIAMRGAKAGKFEPGRVDGEYNQNLQLLVSGIAPADVQEVKAEKQTEASAIARRDKELTPIDVTGFSSGIQHWRRVRDESRFIQVNPNQASYDVTQVAEIVGNILLFQRANGGWPKDYDMLAILTPEQRLEVVETQQRDDTSFDNGNIHSQVEYLAKAVVQTSNPEWQSSCERGFDFMIRSQYPNGGFPQRYPKPKSYHAHVTFNDGVMIGILDVLSNASRESGHFAWLDESRRKQARQAIEKGIECILASQIVVDGKRTGWCQQHDENTLAPRSARSFELASICPQETVAIVQFLVEQHSEKAEVAEAIQSAIAWLDSVKLLGVSVNKVKSERKEFLRHTVDYDIVVVADPSAPPLWARHYEIESNRPIFAGRDGVKKYSLAEIEQERRTGTAWYGGWPSTIIDQKR